MSTILIADACQTTQHGLMISLYQAGFEVHSVGDGFEALAACTRVNPDLLLAEETLPGLAGSEICYLLKKRQETSDITTVVMAEDPRLLIQAPNRGARGTLVKPIHERTLLQKVTSLLAPCPEPAQPITVYTDSLRFLSLVLRIVPTEELTLAVPLDMVRYLETCLDARQKVYIEYEPQEGTKVRREIFVNYLGKNEIVVTMTPRISIQHRRRHYRKPIDMLVHYRLPGELIRMARSLDISGSGMRLTGVRGKVEVGMSIDLQLSPHPDMRMSLRGVVRHLAPHQAVDPLQQQGFEVGIEFEDLSIGMLQRLIIFLFFDPQGPHVS